MKYTKKTYIIVTHVPLHQDLGQFFWDLRQDNKCTLYTFDFNGSQPIKINREIKETFGSLKGFEHGQFVYNNDTLLYDYIWKDKKLISKSDPGYTLIRMHPPEMLIVYKPIQKNTTHEAFVTFVQANSGFLSIFNVYWPDTLDEALSTIQPTTNLTRNQLARSFQMYSEWCEMAENTQSWEECSSDVENTIKILILIVMILSLSLLLVSIWTLLISERHQNSVYYLHNWRLVEMQTKTGENCCTWE